jgi:hypothetical protein
MCNPINQQFLSKHPVEKKNNRQLVMTIIDDHWPRTMGRCLIRRDPPRRGVPERIDERFGKTPNAWKSNRSRTNNIISIVRRDEFLLAIAKAQVGWKTL